MHMHANRFVAPVFDWLHEAAPAISRPETLIEEFGQRLNQTGLPAHRISTGIRVLHPNVRAESVLWERDKPPELRRFLANLDTHDDYLKSPVRVVYEGKQPLRVRLEPDCALDYQLLHELRDDGYRDYICLPLTFSGGNNQIMSVATREAAGFSDLHIRTLIDLARPLGLILQLHTLKRTARTLLDTYVGSRAGKRVLDGSIQRGLGEWISAVVGFADLRGFTRISNELPADCVIELLNEYFGIMTGAVEAHGGEVLKFIGDEVMAIFPYGAGSDSDGVPPEQAAHHALAAARETVSGIAAVNAGCSKERPEIRVGIGLHAGDVFFGNVGASTRLDFTVVGPTVNLASRIAGLSRDLDSAILVSRRTADLIGCHAGYRGAFPVKGFDAPVDVFTPQAYEAPRVAPSVAEADAVQRAFDEDTRAA